MTDTFRNRLRTLGAPEDPVATDTSSEWSAISLLKAIYGKITDGSLAAGVASAAESQIRTAAASAMAHTNNLISRARAAATSAETSAGQAQGFMTTVAGFTAKCAQFMRQTRADAIATAADAVATAADAISTAADVVTVNAQTSVALDASNRAAGYSMAGTRALRAAARAEAAQTAAEDAAASVPASETVVLPVQIFS